MKYIVKITSVCLLFSSCADNKPQTTDTYPTTSVVTTVTVSETEKTTLAALASEDEKTPEKEKTPLVVAFSEYDTFSLRTSRFPV